MMNRIALITILIMVMALAGCNPPPGDEAKTSGTPAGSGTVTTAQAGLPRMVELGAET